MRRAVIALLAPSLASAQWSSWGKCSEKTGNLMSEQVDAKELDLDDHKKTHQIVTVSTETGLLEVNNEALLWQELEQETDPINLIVVYGESRGGTSTLASMIGCSISPSEATPFFAFDEPRESLPKTEGIWASDVLTRTHGGVTKKFVVIDLMNICQTGVCFYAGLTPRVREDAVAKIISMFSELASVFIYNAKGGVDSDKLTLAFSTTRSALIPGPAPAIGSRNSPFLYVVSRVPPNQIQDDTDQTNIKWNEAFYTIEAQTTQNAIKTLLEENFEEHTNGLRLIINPVPRLTEAGTHMSWDGNVPYLNEENSASTGPCGRFNEMITERWECTREDNPSPPQLYRYMVERMVNDIHDQTRPREISLQQDGTEVHEKITGFRLKGIMEASVTEINTAGPVPDNQLWKVIMLERCEKDMEGLVNRTLGSNGGILQLIKEERVITEAEMEQSPTPSAREFGWSALKSKMATFWNHAYENDWPTRRNKFFTDSPLLEAVRGTCEGRGFELAAYYLQEYERYDLEAENLVIEAQNDGLEAENARLAIQLDAALGKLNEMWWDENLYYIIALGVCGVILLCLLLAISAQICMTATSCLACCQDLQTTDHDHRAVFLNAEGGARPKNNGPVVRTGGPVQVSQAMQGPSEAELIGRIEELEVVLQQVRMAKGAP